MAATDRVGVERVRLRIHVDEHGSRIDVGDGKDCRYEGVRRGYDFVTRADVQCAKRELQCGQTGIHADRVEALAVVGELCLEELEVPAEDPIAARRDVVQSLAELPRYCCLLRREVNEWHARAHRCTPSSSSASDAAAAW